jgi:hypothetical protein
MRCLLWGWARTRLSRCRSSRGWARLITQRAVEDEFDAWLGRARYERRPEAPPGLRSGFRPRRVQTAEGELAVEIPQVHEAAEPFVSKLFPRGTKLLRTEPLKAMVTARSSAARRCAMSSRCAIRRGWASCRSRPRHGSATSCASALRRFNAAISTTHSGNSSCRCRRIWRSRGPTGGGWPRRPTGARCAAQAGSRVMSVSRAVWQRWDGEQRVERLRSVRGAQSRTCSSTTPSCGASPRTSVATTAVDRLESVEAST